MARFEVGAAYVMGVALPVLETLRRRTDFTSIAFYADDYIAGALLLAAAHATSHGRRHGPGLLAAAWGVPCGGLYGSTFGQLETLGGTDVSGLPGLAVVLVKGLLFVLALAGLIGSIRSAAAMEAADRGGSSAAGGGGR